mgnify:CR=1 FL=1
MDDLFYDMIFKRKSFHLFRNVKEKISKEEIAKIEDFIKKIELSDNLELEVKTINKGQEYVGTGTEVIIYEKTHKIKIQEYECVVLGDINGDGKITPADYVNIKNHIMNISYLKDLKYEAADVDKNKNITPADYVRVKNHIMNVKLIDA